ncbi:MAG TPA: hypothetical protein VGO03_02685 [Acidimicrobiia bacterium]
MSEAVVVRYVTKAECADENARLVKAVYEELATVDPGGFEYTTFRLDDGVTFLHVAVLDGDDNPLTRSPAFAEFQSGIAARCVEGPAVAPATTVGAYRTAR